MVLCNLSKQPSVRQSTVTRERIERARARLERGLHDEERGKTDPNPEKEGSALADTLVHDFEEGETRGTRELFEWAGAKNEDDIEEPTEQTSSYDLKEIKLGCPE